jgi:hypothetical protein
MELQAETEGRETGMEWAGALEGRVLQSEK